jgi:bifunctional non-homologous end joining protein LigD
VGSTLVSWAVPKGPSLRAGEKRLAVQVEDHPLDYAAFEGVIPEGNYGAGDVRIADRGTWEFEGDAAKAIADGKLDFTLHGERLGGQWKLIRTRTGGTRQQWLLIKRSDPFVADTDLDALVHQAVAPSHDEAGGSRWRDRALKLAGASQGAAEPAVQLATLSATAPDGDDWLHEVKWDGYRLLATRDGDRVRIASRNGNDWTGRYPHIEAALLALPVQAFQLDGELVVLDAHGHSDFAGLQRSLEGSSAAPVACVAFDLLQIEDVDITRVAQLERKLLLEALLAKKASKHLRYSEHVVGHGPEVFAASQREGLEGIISKRADAPYGDGRSKRWLKVKHTEETEAVVVGYTAPRRSRLGVGSLMLALREGKGLRYIGRVGTGMDDATLAALRKKLDAHEAGRARARAAGSRAALTPGHHLGGAAHDRRGGASWLGQGGLLRHASFLREQPDKAGREPARRSEKRPVAAAPDVRLTSPEREVFASPSVTKQDVADYYRAVAPWLLPGIVNRPLSVLRAPHGVPGELFFQKHAGPGFGDAVKAIDVQEKTGRFEAYIRSATHAAQRASRPGHCARGPAPRWPCR